MLEACGDLCIEDDCPTSGTGDINMDGVVNILDIVLTVNFNMGSIELTDVQFDSADLNDDGVIDILDIILMVNLILV